MLGVIERGCLGGTPGLEHCAPSCAQDQPQPQLQPYCHVSAQHGVSWGGGGELEMTALLQRLQSPACGVRVSAETCLAAMVGADVGGAMGALAAEIADHRKPSDTRHIAAIMVKNVLAGSYHHTGGVKAGCEGGIMDVRLQELSQALLTGLCCGQREVGMACAQALAQLCAMEPAPARLVDLVPCLVDIATAGSRARDVTVPRQCALWCLSFICQACTSVDGREVDAVLTAAAAGLQAPPDTGSSSTRLAAGAALAGALRFAHRNFERARERECLVGLVLGMAASSEIEQCRQGFDCVTEMCTRHHTTVLPSLDAVAQLFDSALRVSADGGVVVLAAEALRDICEEDAEFHKEEAHAQGLASQRLAAPAVPHLLLHLRPNDDKDECMGETGSDVTAAAAECLGAVAQAVGDSVLPAVLCFAQGAAASQNWKERYAAAVAVGAVAAGLSEAALRRVLAEFLPTVLTACGARLEPGEKQAMFGCIEQIMTAVADTTDAASALGPQIISRTLGVLRLGTREEAAVAEMACRAVASTVAATGELSSKDHQHTSVLFPYFSGVIGSLLSRAESIPTSDEAVSLQMAAFAAVRDVVTHSPEDCCPMLADLAAVVNRQGADTGRRLQLMAAREMTQQQEAYIRRLRDLQAFLCTMLQEIFIRVNRSAADLRGRLPPCEDVMATVDAAMHCNAHVAGAEVIALMGALADCWGPSFARHMPTLWRAGYRAATDASSPEDCGSALRTFRALCASPHAALMAPYLDILSELALRHIRNAATVGFDTRLACLALLADIAAVQQANFAPYLGTSMSALGCAVELCCAMDEECDESWEMQQGILQAYTRVLQSLPTQTVSAHFGCAKSASHLQSLIGLMEASFAGRVRRRSEQRGATLMCLLELLTVIAQRIDLLRPALTQDGWHRALLQECRCLPGVQAQVATAQQLILKAVHQMG